MSGPHGSDRLQRVELTPLHERLHEVFGNRSFRAIAEATGTSHETVRRYMQGQAPSVEFLEAVCRVAGVNGQWLLTGRGPRNSEQIRAHALKEANVSELLTAMARTLERLQERVDRLEVYMQTIEARMRGMGEGGAAGRGAGEPGGAGGPARLPGNPAGTIAGATPKGGQTPAARRTSDHERRAPAIQVTPDPLERARHIADALAQRPPAPPG